MKDSDAGLSSKELAERYHVSRAVGGCAEAAATGNGRLRAVPANEISAAGARSPRKRTASRALVAAQPDATLTELREALADVRGPDDDLACPSSQLDFTFKKNRTRRRTAAALTSPLSAATGASGCRCAMSASSVSR